MTRIVLLGALLLAGGHARVHADEPAIEIVVGDQCPVDAVALRLALERELGDDGAELVRLELSCAEGGAVLQVTTGARPVQMTMNGSVGARTVAVLAVELLAVTDGEPVVTGDLPAQPAAPPRPTTASAAPPLSASADSQTAPRRTARPPARVAEPATAPGRRRHAPWTGRLGLVGGVTASESHVGVSLALLRRVHGPLEAVVRVARGERRPSDTSDAAGADVTELAVGPALVTQLGWARLRGSVLLGHAWLHGRDGAMWSGSEMAVELGGSSSVQILGPVSVYASLELVRRLSSARAVGSGSDVAARDGKSRLEVGGGLGISF